MGKVSLVHITDPSTGDSVGTNFLVSGTCSGNQSTVTGSLSPGNIAPTGAPGGSGGAFVLKFCNISDGSVTVTVHQGSASDSVNVTVNHATASTATC